MIEAGEIHKFLPHRYPFLLVDRIAEIEPGRRAVGIKNVSVNEPYFQGHFPGHPVMPGVLVLEAMAQVCAFAVLHSPEATGKLAYLVGVDKARFRRPVVPGDQLRLEAVMMRVRTNFGRASCSAFVGDKLVADAEMTFAVVDGARGEPGEVAPARSAGEEPDEREVP